MPITLPHFTPLQYTLLITQLLIRLSITPLDITLALLPPQYASLLSLGTLSYAIGKFFSGFVIDNLWGAAWNLRAMFATSGVCFIAIYALISTSDAAPPSGNFASVAALWMLYRAVSCSSWSATAKLVPVDEQDAKKSTANATKKPFFSFLGIASRSGTIVGMLVLGYLMRFMHLKVWLLTGLIMLAWAVWLYKCESLREAEQKERAIKNNANAADGKDLSTQHPLSNATTMEALRYFLTSPRVYQVSLFMSCTTILTELQSHLPTVLMELLHVDASSAAIASAAYSTGYVVFVLIAGFVYGSLNQEQRAWYLFLHYLLGVFGLFLFCFMPITSVLQASCIVFLMGGFAPTYYIPYSVFCLSHGGKYSATLMGVMDTVSFGSTVVMHACIRGFAAEYGWDQTFLVLFGVSCVGLAAIGSYSFSKDTEV